VKDMLTAEIKVNGCPIAIVSALNLGFGGGEATYRCLVHETDRVTIPSEHFIIKHNRSNGWQGLLNKITGEVMSRTEKETPNEI